MTNRSLTTLAIRFAALLLFMKIFEFFGRYAMSVYLAAFMTTMEDRLNTSFDKFYFHGTFLLISNVIISLLLFFKAEWISARIIKEDKEISVQFTIEQLIMAVLLITGLLWLVSAVYTLPDADDYIRMMIAKFNHEEFEKTRDFSPVYFIMKIIIGCIFVFRVSNVTRFVMKRMTRNQLQKASIGQEGDGSTTSE